jgi:hypothetical protein
MVCEELIYIHSNLPAPSHQPARKAVIHDSAVFEVNLVPQLRTPNRFVIVFIDHPNPLSEGLWCTRRLVWALRVHR